MTHFYTYQLPITIALVIVGIGFFITSILLNAQKQNLVQTLELRIAEHKATLIALSELTDRDGADETIAAIVKDCSVENRNTFDERLNNLGTLSRSQLEETERLFDACAYYFSQRKSLMVARLARELEVYEEFVGLLALLDSRTKLDTFQVAQWRELIALEERRSDLFEEQVTIQYQILVLLKNGKSAASDEVVTLITNAQKGSETVGVLNTQIDSLRGLLLPL